MKRSGFNEGQIIGVLREREGGSPTAGVCRRHGNDQPGHAGMDQPHRHRVALHRAGKPQQNGFVESCNGKLREECLNEEVFANLAAARAAIERWRLDCNHVRPHSAHGGLTPEAVRMNPAAGRYRRRCRSATKPQGLSQ